VEEIQEGSGSRGGYEGLELDNGWRWWVLSREREGLLPVMAGIETVESGSGFRLIRSSMVRCVGALALENGPHVIVKRYRPRGLIRVLSMNMRGPQWRREWEAAHRIVKRGLRTAAPLALGEKRRGWLATAGAVVSSALLGWPSLLEALSADGIRSSHLEMEDLPAVVGRFVSSLHEAGVFHRDLHGDNVLVAWEGGSPALVLLDLHRLRCPVRVSLRSRLWNLAQLLASLQGRISQVEEEAILRGYVESSHLDLSLPELHRDVARLREKLARRHERSRSKRCLVESSSFVVRRWKGLKVYARRGFPVERLQEILDEARSIVQKSDPRALKLSPESRVTLGRLAANGEGFGICVKEYPFRGAARALRYSLGTSRAKAFWKGWWGAKVRGFPVPEVHLMWEERKLGLLTGCGVVMEAMDRALGLDRYVSARFSHPLDRRILRVKRKLNAQMALLLAGLHRKGVLHADLKAGNIVVEEDQDGPRILLLDLDAVRFKRSLSKRDVILNLAQLDASMPASVGVRERLRFMVNYRRGMGGGEDVRGLLREVRALSLARRKG